MLPPIHPFIHQYDDEGLEPTPAVTGWEVAAILDRLPLHHIPRQTANSTLLQALNSVFFLTRCVALRYTCNGCRLEPEEKCQQFVSWPVWQHWWEVWECVEVSSFLGCPFILYQYFFVRYGFFFFFLHLSLNLILHEHAAAMFSLSCLSAHLWHHMSPASEA